MMGVDVKNDKNLIEEYGKIADTFTNSVVERGRKFYYHSDFFYNFSNLKKEQDKTSISLQKLTDMVIKEKEAKMYAQEDNTSVKNSTRFKSFLDLLLDLKNNGVLTESEIRQEVNTFMGAAFNTTYQALGTILLTIGSYPAVQQKIVDEIRAVFKGSPHITERHNLSEMKYLEATVKETMRLYPPVLVIGRTVNQDLKLKKHTLLAGSRCYVSLYHIGRYHTSGVDAERFRPERWLDGSLPQHAGAFGSFGIGKRSCIGSNFAMMLMKTRLLCHVVYAYHISGDVTQLVRDFNVVVTPVLRHHISLQRREI